MSDVNPEAFAEFATQDGPGSADIDEERPDASSPDASAATGEERNADQTAEEFPGERDL